jgi:hypothetical protein
VPEGCHLMMMEAVNTSETSVYFEVTWRYIPESCTNLHTRRRKKLKPHSETSVHFYGTRQRNIPEGCHVRGVTRHNARLKFDQVGCLLTVAQSTGRVHSLPPHASHSTGLHNILFKLDFQFRRIEHTKS